MRNGHITMVARALASRGVVSVAAPPVSTAWAAAAVKPAGDSAQETTTTRGDGGDDGDGDADDDDASGATLVGDAGAPNTTAEHGGSTFTPTKFTTFGAPRSAARSPPHPGGEDSKEAVNDDHHKDHDRRFSDDGASHGTGNTARKGSEPPPPPPPAGSPPPIPAALRARASSPSSTRTLSSSSSSPTPSPQTTSKGRSLTSVMALPVAHSWQGELAIDGFDDLWQRWLPNISGEWLDAVCVFMMAMFEHASFSMSFS